MFNNLFSTSFTLQLATIISALIHVVVLEKWSQYVPITGKPMITSSFSVSLIEPENATVTDIEPLKDGTPKHDSHPQHQKSTLFSPNIDAVAKQNSTISDTKIKKTVTHVSAATKTTNARSTIKLVKGPLGMPPGPTESDAAPEQAILSVKTSNTESPLTTASPLSVNSLQPDSHKHSVNNPYPATSEAYPINPVKPGYPPVARRRGETGRVLVQVELDATGTVLKAFVIESSGYQRLDVAAETAAKQTHYVAARVDGLSVASSTTLPYTFELK